MTSKKGETKAQANRRVRQQALRDQLAEQCRVQHVIDNTKKLEDLKGVTMDSIEVQRIKAANDARLKLIDKYLPSQKSVEVVDEDGNDALPKSIVINVRATDIDT